MRASAIVLLQSVPVAILSGEQADDARARFKCAFPLSKTGERTGLAGWPRLHGVGRIEGIGEGLKQKNWYRDL